MHSRSTRGRRGPFGFGPRQSRLEHGILTVRTIAWLSGRILAVIVDELRTRSGRR
jgi:hypothetical protein